MALTSLANVKEYLGISDTNNDTFLTNLINRVESYIKAHCKRVFAATDHTEYHDGDGTNVLLLRQYPVNSVSSLYDDINRNYSSDTLINTDDYVIDTTTGIIKLDGLTFSVGLQNIKVVYNAGYSSIPADLEEACIELVARKFRQKEKQGISAETIGTYSVKFTGEDVPSEIKSVLAAYRKIR